MSVMPRVVLVTRPTAYEMLVARHATREQARFFLESRGQSIDELESEHECFGEAQRRVIGSVPQDWRLARVGRADLDRFLFERDDVVVALGQDGLVANVAKYLAGQVVVGLNPDRGSSRGVLVKHGPADALELVLAANEPTARVEERTLVACDLDDGQRLVALNEVFVGHVSHQTARYRIHVSGRAERQMSSGMIVATGTGATGWASSVCRERAHPPRLPGPTEEKLAFLVREAFASPSSTTSLTQGVLPSTSRLRVVSEMGEGGVVFGDGIESDRVEFMYGSVAEIYVAEERLRLLA